MKPKSLIEKLKQAERELEEALKYTDKAKGSPFHLKGIAKSYEVCFEYAWKYLQQKVTEDAAEAYGPKETIKHAGRLNLIDSVEQWLGFLQDRNFSVHDYLGIPDEEYLKTVSLFHKEIKRLLLKEGV